MATKRKNPKRVAAGKKAARTRKKTKRRSTTMTKASHGRKSAKRVSAGKKAARTRKRNKGMGDIFTPAAIQGTGRMLIRALAGVGGAIVIDKMAPSKWNNQQKAVAIAVGAITVGAALGQPEAAAGMIGVAGYKVAQEVGLADDGDDYDYVNIDALEMLPPVIDGNGQMSEGDWESPYEYMNDDFTPSSYQATYAPPFGGGWQY